MITALFLGLLTLFSASSYAMENQNAMALILYNPEMTLIANDGIISVPTHEAMRSEVLRAHASMADNTGDNPQLYLFHRQNVEELAILGQDEDIVCSSAKSNVLRDLFAGISNPDHIRAMADFGPLQKLFVMADYLQVPSYTCGLALCRLLNSLRTDEAEPLKPRVAGMIHEQLRRAIQDHHLYLRDAGFSNLDGLLAFFDTKHYERPEDALDGCSIESIDLSKNRLQEINFSLLLKRFPNLRQLDLNHNELTDIDVRCVPYGFRIDLSHNRLENAQFPGRQQQLYVNCMHNPLSPAQARSVERGVHRGDKLYWTRKGVAFVIPAFNPGACHMSFAGWILQHYFVYKVNSSLSHLQADFSDRTVHCVQGARDKSLGRVPAVKRIVGRDIPVRRYFSTALNVGSTAGIVAGARRLGGSWSGIGLSYLLSGRSGVFLYNIVRPLFNRRIRDPLYNRVINPVFARLGQEMNGLYVRHCLPYIALMNEYITRDSNRLQLGDQCP